MKNKYKYRYIEAIERRLKPSNFASQKLNQKIEQDCEKKNLGVI